MDEERVEHVLEIVLREIRAYAQGFRLEEFLDGRTVRDSYQGVANWAEAALLDGGLKDYTEGTEMLEINEKKQ